MMFFAIVCLFKSIFHYYIAIFLFSYMILVIKYIEKWTIPKKRHYKMYTDHMLNILRATSNVGQFEMNIGLNGL